MELIHLPKIGLAAEPVKVLELLKAPGDALAIGDEVLAIETEKAAVEVQSSALGTLGRYLVAADDVIAPGTAVAVVLGAGEALDEVALARLLTQSRPADAPALDPAPLEPAARPPRSGASPAPVKASPRVRKLASERRIDLAQVAGTGPDGVVTEADLDRAAASAGVSAKGGGDAGAGERLSGIPAAVAARMARAWREIPHIHQIVEIEADGLIAARRSLNVSLTPLLVKAVAIALGRHPTLNAHFDGERLIRLSRVNIAVAVGDDDTLLTPTICDADRLSVTDLARALKDLRDRVATGRLTAADLADGGYTISNLGMFGIDTGTPIINPPQVGLMFVGTASGRLVLRDRAVVERQFMKVTLSYDHRVVSGIPAARFTQEIRNLLEAPDWAVQ